MAIFRKNKREFAYHSKRNYFVVIGHPKSLVSIKSMECLMKKTCAKFEYPTISNLSNSFFGEKYRR